MYQSSYLQKTIWILLILFGIVMMPNGQAFAYLDPGTGSFLIQIVVASLLGLLMVLRVFWMRIVLFFQGIFRKSQTQQDDDLDDI